MNAKKHNVLANFNRGLVLVLSLAEILTDGIQVTDLLGVVAVIVWLWMSFCIRMEARFLARISDQ